MLFLLLIVAVASAVYSEPIPRAHLVNGAAYVQDVRLTEEKAAPRGLPWQQVIAPYTQQPPAVSEWVRK